MVRLVKRFQAIEYTISLIATPSGASIGRGLIERRVILPDGSLMVIWWLLVILDWLFTLPARFLLPVYDWLFVGWAGDLQMIGAAIREFVPQTQGI